MLLFFYTIFNFLATGLKVPQESVRTLMSSNSNIDECTAGLQLHQSNLRKQGFNIPINGEHKGFGPNGVEGGASQLEVKFLMQIMNKTYFGVPKDAVVCQTGFNYGTSAFAFLCSGALRVLSWDLGEHDYVQKASDLIEKQFPGRHSLVLGDSTKTLKDASLMTDQRCDVVFVDGGHTFDIAKSDMENFKSIAKPGALVVLDDCIQKKDFDYLHHITLFDYASSVLESKATTSRTTDSAKFWPSVMNAFESITKESVIRPEEPETTFLFDNLRSVCVGRYT